MKKIMFIKKYYNNIFKFYWHFLLIKWIIKVDYKKANKVKVK